MAKKKTTKEREARGKLIKTIAKISELEPTMGGKWREGMLNFYYYRLAELILYQAGIDVPANPVIATLARNIRYEFESAVISTGYPG